MDLSTFKTQVTDLIRDVWLISESEYPFNYLQPDASDPGDLPVLLAQKHQAGLQAVKAITPENFMTKIDKAASGSDSIIVANARKIEKLLEFLQQHLRHLAVYRIEAGVSIPVYIAGFLPDGTCVGVSSTSIET